MSCPRWQDVQHEFEFDGAWRDIYVQETDRNDWQCVLDVVTTTYPTACFQGSDLIPPPSVSDLFMPDRVATLLTTNVAGIELNCHFFTPGELEFDLDPRDVKGQAHLDAILGFLRLLADVTQKPAILTYENSLSRPIFKFAPNSIRVEYFPA